MSLIKFNEKNVSLLGKVESVAGTFQTDLAATDALALAGLTGSITTETGEYVYLGSDLSRDKFVYQTDSYADLKADTPQQVLGTVFPSAVSDIPLAPYYRVSGGNITIDTPNAKVYIDNSISESSTMSIEYRKSSAEDIYTQKTYEMFGLRGILDISANVRSVPLLSFNLKGNSNITVQKPYIEPNIGTQQFRVCAAVRQPTIVRAEVAQLDGIYTTTSAGSHAIARTLNFATITSTGLGTELGGVGTIRGIEVSGATGVNAPLYNGTFLGMVTGANTVMYRTKGTPSGSATGTIVVKKGPPAQAFCFSTLQAANFFGYDLARFATGCEEGFDRTTMASDVSATITEAKANRFAVTSLTSVTTTATITLPKGHGITAGSKISVVGADQTGYNVTNVTPLAVNTGGGGTTDTITYTVDAGVDDTATGLIRVIHETSNTFDPDAKLLNYFGMQLKFGTGQYKYVTYLWDKLQVSNVAEDKVSTYWGRNITFSNTGSSTIILD